MKVAILGFGKEGKAALRYFREKDAEITVFDENPEMKAHVPPNVHFKAGKNCFEHAKGYDVVVRSPAINPVRIKTDGIVTDNTKLFFDECLAPIIGVTGTKGKGTTSSLIFEMLKNAGVRVHLAGNIGVPVLDILPDVRPRDVVVLELSSFQLWQLKKSPQVAVVLMLEPDHLEVHTDMDDYIAAKTNIAKWQAAGDAVIFHPTNKYAAAIAHESKGAKLRYAKPPAAHVENGEFVIDGYVICATDDLLLPGGHNIENACAAITAAWQYTQNTGAIAQALMTFKGLDHRLRFVVEAHGVEYYDDSFASAPGATVVAIRAFSHPEVLICGGYDRGLEYAHLAKAIATQKNIKKVLLIGQTAKKIAAALEKEHFNKFEIMKTKNLESIIEHARQTAEPGDVVILSPGCASFDMFKNFSERGEQFKQIVMKLV